MQELLTEILNMISTNADTLLIAVATGIATVLVFLLKQIFTLLAALAGKTKTALDDTLVKKIKEIFKSKVGEM